MVPASDTRCVPDSVKSPDRSERADDPSLSSPAIAARPCTVSCTASGGSGVAAPRECFFEPSGGAPLEWSRWRPSQAPKALEGGVGHYPAPPPAAAKRMQRECPVQILPQW